MTAADARSSKGRARGDLTEVVSALPSAVNPFALSLNENPFPPLPGVRSVLSESVDVANRYPEFLPERLRALIAGHVGVHEEQVVIGAGATGVIMQVLSAVTSPGDRMVMTSPTFDGYPIFARWPGWTRSPCRWTSTATTT